MRSLVFLPGLLSTRVLVGQSDISFTYYREKEQLVTKGVPAVLKRLIFHELELYTCTIKEISSLSSLEEQSRSKILDPVQFIYESTETKQNAAESTFNIVYCMGKLKFVVSHRDFMVLGSVIKLPKKNVSLRMETNPHAGN